MKRKLRWQWILAAVLLGAMAQGMLGLMTRGWVLLTGLPEPIQPLSPETKAGTVLRSLLLVTAVPLAEEWLFRELLCRWLEQRTAPRIAGLCTAAAFALCHGSLSGMPALFLFGLCAWLFREKSGSWLTAVFFHAAYNACALLLMRWM